MKVNNYEGVTVNEQYVEYENFSNEFVDGLSSVAEDVSALSSVCFKNRLAYGRMYKKLKNIYPEKVAKYDKAFEELEANSFIKREKTKRNIETISVVSEPSVLVEIANSASKYALTLEDDINMEMSILRKCTKDKGMDVDLFMDYYFDVIDHSTTARSWVKTLGATVKRTCELKSERVLVEENQVKVTRRKARKFDKPAKTKSKARASMSR